MISYSFVDPGAVVQRYRYDHTGVATKVLSGIWGR